MNMKLNSLLFTLFLLISSLSNCEKVVLITGANQGLGLATAIKLSKSNFTVYATHRKSSNVNELSKAALESNGTLIPILLDVTNEKSISEAVEKIINQNKKIDILINNACEVVLGTCEMCTIEEQKRVMDVNYFGVVRMIHEVLPHMRTKNSGHIINISSVAGFSAFTLIETYVATKFALEGLTESLATYLHNWNIKITLIEPAGVNTNVAFNSNLGSRNTTQDLINFCEKSYENMKKVTPELQNPKEIAELIEKVINDENPNLRYQTNEFSLQLAKDHFIDPTGNTNLINKRREFEKAFNKD